MNEQRRGRFMGLMGLAAGFLVLVSGAALAPRIISGICFGLLGLACVCANSELAPAFHPSSDRPGRLAAVLLGALLVVGGIVRLG